MGAPRVFLSRSSPQSSFLPPKGSHTPNPVLWGRRWGEPWGEVSLPCLVTPPDPPTPLHPPHSILTPTLTASWTSKHPLNTQRGGGGSNPSPLQLRGDPKDAGLALSPPLQIPTPTSGAGGQRRHPGLLWGRAGRQQGSRAVSPHPVLWARLRAPLGLTGVPLHMGTLVPVAVRAAPEAFPTLGTRKGFLTRVGEPMPVVMGAPRKALPTQPAPVGLLPTVQPSVPLQVGSDSECPPALPTTEWFLPGVDAAVPFQMGEPTEGLPARPAWVRWLHGVFLSVGFRVGLWVFGQRWAPLEAMFAVGPLGGVDATVFEVGGLREGCAALLKWGWGRGGPVLVPRWEGWGDGRPILIPGWGYGGDGGPVFIPS